MLTRSGLRTSPIGATSRAAQLAGLSHGQGAAGPGTVDVRGDMGDVFQPLVQEAALDLCDACSGHTLVRVKTRPS